MINLDNYNVKREYDLQEALRKIASQLRAWANESLNGGWSTHQVQPQRDLATQIEAMLGRK